MANASKKGGGMGSGTVGHQHVGTTDPEILDEHDLANEMKGNNQLQGNDQAQVQNQRLTQPGSLDADNQPPAPVDPLASGEKATEGRR